MSGSSAGRRSEWFPSCVSLWCSSVCLLWLIRVVPAHIGSTGDLLGRQRVSGVVVVVSFPGSPVLLTFVFPVGLLSRVPGWGKTDSEWFSSCLVCCW